MAYLHFKLNPDGTRGSINVYDSDPGIANGEEDVVIEYKSLNSDTLHPAYRNWIQNYALACAKGALGQIRGKYQTVPSPGGGAKLNGDALIKESQDEKEKLLKRLLDEFEEPARFSTF